MKLTVGLPSTEDYLPFLRAGADEVFFGAYPTCWQPNFGGRTPINRREVLAGGAQIGGEAELRRLAALVKEYRMPAVLALNAPSYPPQQYPSLAEFARHCLLLGLNRMILADPGLILYFSRQLHPFPEVHLSGEFGELNPILLRQLAGQGVRRVIFHRQVSPEEMDLCLRESGLPEAEAFLLNEKCHFHGAYCSSLHCDEMAALCRLPFRLSGPQSRPLSAEAAEVQALGESGCGLCALWQLQAVGISHLKIAGRGGSREALLRDLKAGRTALDLLASSRCEAEYISAMKNRLFPDGCSRCCYYPIPGSQEPIRTHKTIEKTIFS